MIGRPVARISASTALGASSGLACWRTAATPAAAGDAAEVPLKYNALPPRPEATQNAPGASSERSLAEFEKQTIVSGETDRSSQKGSEEPPQATKAKGSA